MPMTKRQRRELEAKRFTPPGQRITRGLELALLALVLIELAIIIAWRMNGGHL